MNKKSCVYPGSFDPPTLGHLDIIKRASGLFDEVFVAVLNNTGKQTMFSIEERVEMLTEAAIAYNNVSVIFFDGLLVKLLVKINSNIVLRGVRNGIDFESEEQMANTNRILKPDCETVLLMARPNTNHIRSSIIKELIKLNADISLFVPKSVTDTINRRKQDENTRTF